MGNRVFAFMLTHRNMFRPKFPEKTGHFIGGVGYVYTEEIIAIIQSMRNTSTQGIDIFHYHCILYSQYIVVNDRINVLIGKMGSDCWGHCGINPRNSEIRKFFSCYFFGMTGTQDRKIIFQCKIKLLFQVIVQQDIFLR